MAQTDCGLCGRAAPLVARLDRDAVCSTCLVGGPVDPADVCGVSGVPPTSGRTLSGNPPLAPCQSERWFQLGWVKTAGIETAGASTRSDQISSPVAAFKARTRESMEAPMKTTPQRERLVIGPDFDPGLESRRSSMMRAPTA